MSFIDLVFVERGTPEWDRVWALLSASTGGDLVQRCGCCGESWQYMGSFAEAGTVGHEFRHRHCPTTGQREYRRFTDGPPTYQDGRGRTVDLRPVAETLSPQAQALLKLITEGRR